MTEQLSLFEYQTLDGKIKRSIEVIQLAAKMSEEYYKKPLLVCYSGGKDSDVLLDLVKRANVPFEVQHGLTTVDAPPTVQHVKKVFRELEEQGVQATIKKATYKGEPITMWRLIEIKKLPPTRLARYCCSVFKETSTPNRLVCLGVRRAESSKRAMRKEFELRGARIADAIRYDFEHVMENYDISHDYGEAFDCKIIASAKENNDIICNPIVYWQDRDVWGYIEEYNVNMNPLYSKGYKRVGCVGCPFASAKEREIEFRDFPQYKQNYIKAFDRMIQKGKADGKTYRWEDGADCFEWWLYGGENKKPDDFIEGQESLFEGG